MANQPAPIQVPLEELQPMRWCPECNRLAPTHARYCYHDNDRVVIGTPMRQVTVFVRIDEMAEHMSEHGHEAVEGSDEGYGPRVRND